MTNGEPRWGESDSADFLRWGDIFVPAREMQTRILVELVPTARDDFRVVDLGCGEGRLSGAILERHPRARVSGVDASEAMLGEARRVVGARFAGRFQTVRSRLEEFPKGIEGPAQCVVSSLAVHHLDDPGKRRLFGAVAATLAPGGAFLLADVVLPARSAAHQLAASLWDEDAAARARARNDPEAIRRFRADGWNMYALEALDPEDHPAPLVDLLDWLREAGFDAVDVPWLFAGHAIVAAWVPA